MGENTTVRLYTVTELRLCFEQNAHEIIYFKISLPCFYQLHNFNGLIWGNSIDSSNYLTSKRKLLEHFHALKEALAENYLRSALYFYLICFFNQVALSNV